MSARPGKVRALRRWCLDLPVDAYGKALLHTLIQYVDEDGECWPSVERIAREAGMSRRKAGSVIRALAEAGIIGVEQSTGRTPHRYTLDANRARRAQLNRARKAQLNRARRAGLKSANRARRVTQPRTACALSVKSGNSAGQDEEVSTGNVDREVLP